MRRGFILLVTAVALFGLVACSGGSKKTSGADEGGDAGGDDPAKLDPGVTDRTETETKTVNYACSIREGTIKVKEGADGELLLKLAEHADPDPDKKIDNIHFPSFDEILNYELPDGALAPGTFVFGGSADGAIYSEAERKYTRGVVAGGDVFISAVDHLQAVSTEHLSIVSLSLKLERPDPEDTKVTMSQAIELKHKDDIGVRKCVAEAALTLSEPPEGEEGWHELSVVEPKEETPSFEFEVKKEKK